MKRETLKSQTVHDLQELAQKATHRRPHRPKGLSRAAHLHLIDVLSRRGGPGLAFVGGVSVFVAIMAGRIYPLRTIVWVTTMFVTLAICRKLRREFRSGEKNATRPFRWRASYAASLCVLGAAFGSSAILLLPENAPNGLTLEVISLVTFGALGASVLHGAHARSAIAVGLPSAIFALAGIWRLNGVTLSLFGGAATFAAGAILIFFIWRANSKTANSRFPRMGLQRQEFDSEPYFTPSHIRNTDSTAEAS